MTGIFAARTLLCLTLVLVLIGAGGCGGDDDGGDASGDTAAGQTGTAAGGEGGGSITFNTWGGAYQEAQEKAIVAPFEQEFGIDVNVTHPIDYAKLRAMVESGNVTWDVADVENFVSVQGCNEGWLEKLDFELIPKDRFVPEMPTTDCSVPTGAFTLLIAYREDKWPNGHPTNWQEFFDLERFPGKRALPKYAQSGVLEAALLADGVSKEELYPLDADRAFKKLDTIKDSIVWWESGDQFAQMMKAGEVPICACWVTRIYDIYKEGAPVAVEWQDQIVGWDDFVIPKGAKNVEGAMQFIEFATRPEQSLGMTEHIPWGPSAAEAAANPTTESADWLPTTPEHIELAATFDYAWWGENADALNERFAQWLLE
jgi:putative spermidine/putrescine transport system substrate-binding protein